MYLFLPLVNKMLRNLINIKYLKRQSFLWWRGYVKKGIGY